MKLIKPVAWKKWSLKLNFLENNSPSKVELQNFFCNDHLQQEQILKKCFCTSLSQIVEGLNPCFFWLTNITNVVKTASQDAKTRWSFTWIKFCGFRQTLQDQTFVKSCDFRTCVWLFKKGQNISKLRQKCTKLENILEKGNLICVRLSHAWTIWNMPWTF